MKFGNAVISMVVMLALVSTGFLWLIGGSKQYVPATFSEGTYIQISQGESLRSIAERLEEDGIISSSFMFRLISRVLQADSDIKSGTYFFLEPQTIIGLIQTFTRGDFKLPTKKITIFEGEAAFEFAKRVEEQLPTINAGTLRTLIDTKNLEGYLYPDTYFVPVTATEEELVSIFTQNFRKRVQESGISLTYKNYTEEEIVIMASIVEREAGAGTYEEKQKVAGVLWKRLEIGMPLQVDAVFAYIYKQHLPRVLFKHLAVSSPYNTYKNKGLTPGPIGNPSIEAIRATLNPMIGKDLYYLTGTDGVFYFSQTLSVHERNRRLYIK